MSHTDRMKQKIKMRIPLILVQPIIFQGQVELLVWDNTDT